MGQARIDAIDTLKGVSMIMIWYAHFMIPLWTADWETLFRWNWLVLDFFGPAAFMMLSTLGVMISTRNRFARGDTRLVTLPATVKACLLLIIGEILNLPWYLDGFRLVNWNVVTTIAIFSLLLPAIMRLPRGVRMALAALIVFTYYPLLDWSMATVTATGMQPVSMGIGDLVDTPTVVYFALFFHPATTPVYSWLLMPLVGSVIFEPFTSSTGTAGQATVIRQVNRIGAWGAILIGLSVLTGLKPVPGIAWHVYTLPAFWARHTPQYVLYSLGIVCVLFAIIGRYQARGKKFPWQDHVDTFGRHSLTAFALSHVAMIAGWMTSETLKFQYPVFMVVYVSTIVVVVNLFYFWSNRLKGTFTIEWAIQTCTVLAVRHIEARVTARPPRPGSPPGSIVGRD